MMDSLMHIGLAVMAVSPKGQPSGLSLSTLFGTVGTAIGILGVAAQFSSSFRRRKYKHAEDRLFRAVEASESISSSLSKVEQYEKMKETLQREIETQIPRQARNAYLANRLEQLTDDLHRTYRDYQDVRRELGQRSEMAELDWRVRNAIEASIPGRRIQESRNLYLLLLVIALIILNISPFGVNRYFQVIGFPVTYTAGTVFAVMISGALCLTLMLLVAFSFMPVNNVVLARFRSLGIRGKVISWIVPLLIAGGAAAAGSFLWNDGAINYYSLNPNYGDLSLQINFSETCFNVVVVTVSVMIAASISLKQTKAGIVWSRVRLPESEATEASNKNGLQS